MVDFRAGFLICPLFEPDLSACVSNPRVSLILASLLLWIEDGVLEHWHPGGPPLIRLRLLERTALASPRRPSRLEPDPRHAVVAHAQLVCRRPG
jgi:hypothetical protein